MWSIEDLLSAWDHSRDPELAKLILQRYRGSEQSILHLVGKARSAAWDELLAAGKLEWVTPLLEGLPTRSSSISLDRLNKVTSHRPDPRFWTWMLNMIETPPFQALSTIPFWEKMLPLLKKHFFPAELPRLTQLANGSVARLGVVTMGTWMDKQLQALLPELKALQHNIKPLDPQILAYVQAELEANRPEPISEQKKTLDALWQEVFESPDQDAPKAVLADALTEAGSPRGEFIALQLRDVEGRLDTEGARRMASLLKKHSREWSEPFGGALIRDSLEWERGFLVKGSIPGGMKKVQFQKIIGRPEWRMFKSLSGPVSVPFVTQTDLSSLREIHGVTLEVLCELGKKPNRLERLELLGYQSEDRDAWNRFTSQISTSFPALKQLTIALWWIKMSQVQPVLDLGIRLRLNWDLHRFAEVLDYAQTHHLEKIEMQFTEGEAVFTNKGSEITMDFSRARSPWFIAQIQSLLSNISSDRVNKLHVKVHTQAPLYGMPDGWDTNTAATRTIFDPILRIWEKNFGNHLQIEYR